MTSIAEKFGDFKSRNFGSGIAVKQMPQKQITRMDNFSIGLNKSDDPEGIAPQSMAVATDFEVDERNRLRRAPGTTYLGTYGAVYEPKQILSATTTFNTQKAILFDRAGNVGHKHGPYDTVWTNLGLDVFTIAAHLRYTGVSFGDQFVFSNGLQVWSFDFSGNLFDEPSIPPFKSAAISQGRLYIAYETTVQWCGVVGPFIYKDFSSITSGGEDLISNESTQTDIIALRAINNDVLAILGRDTIWVGVPTGDPTRPLDFQQREKGGCIAEATAITITGGVAYLAADGIRVFNGSTTEPISQAINIELLPLELDQQADAGIKQYYSSYNPDTKNYYLHTGVCTYVLDIKYKRWFKRSLFCYGGIQLYNATSDSKTRFVFLGLDGINSNLEYEDYSSLKYFGSDFSPIYEGPTTVAPGSKELKMVNAVNITYSGYGTIQLYLQNQVRQYESVTDPIALPLSSDLHAESFTFIHTGELLGLKFVLLSGKLEISAIEIEWLQRGMNFDAQIRNCHFEQNLDGSFFITDIPGPAYGWYFDTVPNPDEIVFDSTLVGPKFAVVGYDTDGSPFIEV